jgi:class 3 adenylate cyclase
MDTAQIAALASGNRVDLSFAFIDLCGFTDLVDTDGDEVAVTELRSLRASLREIAPLFGIRIDKWLGDGALLIGTDMSQLVAAVVALHDRHGRDGRLPLRAGIATGSVLMLEGDDYTGRAVNLAARLCDAAEAGQILASTAELEIPEWVRAAGEHWVELRGLAEPVRAVTLEADAAALRQPSSGITSLMEGLTRPVRSLRHGPARG